LISSYLSPPKDTDGDGLPDSWELQYGLNINLPDDASIDLDGDGLSNLAEFDMASDPTISNKMPTVTNNTLLVYEQGRVQFRPCILDSDTQSDALRITLITIPTDITLTGFGNIEKGSGYVFQPGDCMSLQDIEQGNIIMSHTPLKIEAWSITSNTSTDMIVVLDDGIHPPVKETLIIQVFMPSATDGNDSQVWLDATVNQQKFSDYHEWLTSHVEKFYTPLLPQMTFFGRSGNQLNDYLKFYGHDDWTGKEIEMTQEGLPQGKQAINLQGDSFLEYYTDNQQGSQKPFSMSGDTSVFAVIKASGDTNQVIATDSKSELSVTGDSHPIFARRLKFAISEDKAIYSAMPIDKQWGIAGLFKNTSIQRLEWNGHYNGGRYPIQDMTQLSISHSLGGKVMGNPTSVNYHTTDLLNGALGEVLVFNKSINFENKWRIYAYLLSKWFDYIVLDVSNMTINTRQMATSAAEIGFSEEYNSILNSFPFISDLSEYDQLLLMFTARIPNLKDQYETFKAQYGPDKHYILIGGPAQDNLVGGWEDDILVAGLGEDRLIGLGGADHFVVLNETIVVDYAPWEGDILDLSYLLMPDNDNYLLDHYLSLESDKSGTLIHIDMNGDGSGFTDATVFLSNITLHNYDLPKLWANGGIITGGPHPKIELGLEIETVLSDQWTEIEAKPIEIRLTGTIPNGLLLPFDLAGNAEIGKDYHLGIDYYNSKTGSYDIYETETNALPISIDPDGQQAIKIYIFPHKDSLSEKPETINITLRDVIDYYNVSMDKKQVDLLLTDGPDYVQIFSTVNQANADCKLNGEVKIVREGSLDQDLKIKLAIQGTAKMGTDFYYIPSEMIIPANKNEISFSIRPISSETIDRDKVVEVFLMESDQYNVQKFASARVTITNRSIIEGDINGDGNVNLADLIAALQVCVGKNSGVVYDNGRIDMSDVLFLMRVMGSDQANQLLFINFQ
jgi:hypothetical protein